MSTFTIVNDIELPAKSTTRNRDRGEFASTLDTLEIGQGFRFPSHASLKNMYPRVAPKKFGGKHFTVAQITAPVEASEGVEAAEGIYAVKRTS